MANPEHLKILVQEVELWNRWRKAHPEVRPDLRDAVLEEAWKTCDWPGPLRHQIEKYYIVDFSAWREHEIFEQQFGRLIEGLGLFYPEQK